MARKIKPPKRPFFAPDDDDLDDDTLLDVDAIAGSEGLLKAFGKSLSQVINLDDIPDEGEDLPGFVPISLDDEDISLICGAANAVRGLAILERGAVQVRAFDGTTIRAYVADGPEGADVQYTFETDEYQCSRNDETRGRVRRACVHVAALMQAWTRQPQSFALANLGAALELYSSRPELFTDGELSRAQLDILLVVWQDASPELRKKIGHLSARPSPAEIEQLQTLMNEAVVQQRNGEFADLFDRFTLEQLRGIAKRRRWTLRAGAKAKAIAELMEHLRASPLPESFTPEEEQLVRIENTLWGLEGYPRHQDLLADWQQHGGGNRKRLEQALEGLQNVGVLLPCTGEGMGLHYHWSPFVRSDMLPLLQPKIALLPSKAGPGPDGPEPLPAPLPLLVVLDAVLSFAEREPLRLRPTPAPVTSGESELVGDWPYAPEEVQEAVELLFKRARAPAALTIPFSTFFADESIEALASLAGGAREYGIWAALQLVNAGVLQYDTAAPGLRGEMRVDPEKANVWRMLAPDQQLERLWQTWCAGGSLYHDFRIALQDKGFILRRIPRALEFPPQMLVQDVGLGRKFVVRVLAMLSPQTWYAWPALAATIQRLRGNFLYTYTTPQQWWVEHAPSARRYDPIIPQQWEAAWQPVLQQMLAGPLRWFGAIDASEQRGPADALSGFRVTPLGAWLFSGGRRGRVPEFAAAAPAQAGPSFEWLDETTFRVRAAPDAMQALQALRVYVEPTRELLTFRLSLPAVGRALAQGAALSSIVEAFGAAGLPLAAAVQERIAALGERSGRLNLYERVTVLELGDDMALRELLASTSLRAHIVHEFSPRLVVVRDDAVDALLAELVKKGHTPLTA